jgi:hypothetical protein
LNINILQQVCFCKAIKISVFVLDLTPGPSPKERGAGIRHSAQATPLLGRGAGGEVCWVNLQDIQLAKAEILNSQFSILNSQAVSIDSKFANILILSTLQQLFKTKKRKRKKRACIFATFAR